jgi:hypothetical protein
LKLWFEEATTNRFDVKLLGQATWYLQSRITQLADCSIVLGQSRYAALITARYLPPLNDATILNQRKTKYASPLPTSAVFTKRDCSPNYASVLRLQEEFDFDYAAVIGSLIWLMNTYITMSFAFRKLAKFMQFPGKQHFLYLKHLLHHLQSNRCSGGIKFYSNVQPSPLYQFMVDNGNVEHALAPIIQFTDSSFQDYPDTSRSTGGYLTLFIQGAVVEAVSTMPTIVSQSTCVAEYCIASLAVMAGSYLKKSSTRYRVIIRIVHSQSPSEQTPNRELTQQTPQKKPTARVILLDDSTTFVIVLQMAQLYCSKVQGTNNPADCLTKPLAAPALQLEANVFQVEVDP